MAASDPQGQMQFWHEGQPVITAKKEEITSTQMQFWHEGQPLVVATPSTGTSTARSYGMIIS